MRRAAVSLAIATAAAVGVSVALAASPVAKDTFEEREADEDRQDPLGG